MRNGSTGRAVLRLCAVCSRATAVAREVTCCRLIAKNALCRRARVVFAAPRLARVSKRDLEALPHVLSVIHERKRLFFGPLQVLKKKPLKKAAVCLANLEDFHFLLNLAKCRQRSKERCGVVAGGPQGGCPRARSDAFPPILPPVEARNIRGLKIGRPGTGRLEIGRPKGSDWRLEVCSCAGGLLPRRLRCWNLS